MHSSPVPPPSPASVHLSTLYKKWDAACVQSCLCAALSCGLAVPCCDRAGVAQGQGELTPATPLGSFTAGCEGVLGAQGGSGRWVQPGANRVPSRVVDAKPRNLPALPGRRERALFKALRTSLVLPFLCREGEGCCLWRFSMVLLNQVDRFWLLLSLCWFSFFFFFFLFPLNIPSIFSLRLKDQRAREPALPIMNGLLALLAYASVMWCLCSAEREKKNTPLLENTCHSIAFTGSCSEGYYLAHCVLRIPLPLGVLCWGK